jgi:hypothetical protein
MTTFARVLMGPKGTVGALLTPGKASAPEVQKLIPDLHRALLRCSDLIDCHVSLAGQDVGAIWLPSGQTAGVVFLGRADAVDVVCALLCGLDDREDAHAIARATQSCTARGWAAMSIPETRPLLAMAFNSPEAYADRALATAAVAWGVAFFTMLGVGEPELTESS